MVITVGFLERGTNDGWRGDGRHRDCWWPEVSSHRRAGPGWKQLSADLVEIGQRKHGLRACQVLSQTAIPYFGEAPQLFDYPKGVFAARPGPRARPVDHSPALAQGPLGGGTPVDPVAHSPCLEKLSIFLLPVRLIAEQLPLLPVQQIRQTG